jgi:putative Ca2+/H+ antiporter (TMEM165/GDT1 family)
MLLADRTGGNPATLGRAMTEHYFTTALPSTTTTSIPPTTLPPSVELALQQHAGDVTAIPAPLIVGLEHSSALVHALLASFSVILVSELGDKTFIITAIMAMKNSRSLVFMSSAFALFLMTVLSVGMGVAVTVIPALYTHYASIVLFLCFGLKMLKEAYDMDADSEDGESEFDEVKRSLEQDELARKLQQQQTAATVTTTTAVGGEQAVQQQSEGTQPSEKGHQQDEQTKFVDTKAAAQVSTNYWSKLVETLYVAPIVIKVFTMILVAEWGDRSQISTVILAAREDVVGVFIGSFSGHVLCTGLAVIGGRVVAEIISIRTLTFLGGLIFLFFATFAIVAGPE